MSTRAYELMVIFSGDLDESGFQTNVRWAEELAKTADADVANIEVWGRRAFAYEIDHKTEGYYAIYELRAEPGAMDSAERSLRLADHVVRHKLIRLPDDEAAKRGLVEA